MSPQRCRKVLSIMSQLHQPCHQTLNSQPLFLKLATSACLLSHAGKQRLSLAWSPKQGWGLPTKNASINSGNAACQYVSWWRQLQQAMSNTATMPLGAAQQLEKSATCRLHAAVLQQRNTLLAKPQDLTTRRMIARLSTHSQAPVAVRFLADKATSKVASAVQKGLGSRLSTALSLQFSALWQSYSRTFLLLVGVVAAYLLWRFMFRVASLFINMTESMAEYGFMGAAITIITFVFLYLRRYYGVDAGRVYRLAMRELNTHPGVLEVMGPPLVGSEVRAYVTTGGGLYLSPKSFRPKYRPRRVQMIFPLTGRDRRGLVSLEAKKKQGKYDWKLLAVDVQPDSLSLTGTRAKETDRIYMYGNADVYNKGSILGELRDPFLKALAMQKQFEIEDEVEEELDMLQASLPQKLLSEESQPSKPWPLSPAGPLYPPGTASAFPTASPSAPATSNPVITKPPSSESKPAAAGAPYEAGSMTATSQVSSKVETPPVFVVKEPVSTKDRLKSLMPETAASTPSLAAAEAVVSTASAQMSLWQKLTGWQPSQPDAGKKD